MKKSSIPLAASLLLIVLLHACVGGSPTPLQTSESNVLATMVAATISSIPTLIPPPGNNLSPPPESSARENWQTYTSEYGFTFQYPSDKFELLGDNPITLENTILPRVEAQSMNGWLRYEISIMPIDPSILVSDWVAQNWPNQDQAIQADITIDGVHAVKFHNPNFEPKTNVYVFLIVNDILVQISGHYLNVPDSPYYEQIKSTWLETTDNLLSSFKFTK